MLQEPVPGLLPNLGTDGVFGLLWFLEELGDLLKRGVWLLLFSFGILDVLQEQSVRLVVDLLGCSLGMSIHVFLQRAQPVDLLSWHKDLNLLTIFL